jgi:hypothetical protein
MTGNTLQQQPRRRGGPVDLGLTGLLMHGPSCDARPASYPPLPVVSGTLHAAISSHAILREARVASPMTVDTVWR